MGARGHMNISVLGGRGPECEGQPLRDLVLLKILLLMNSIPDTCIM